MRKLKQAAQRQKARRALKEKKEQSEAARHNGLSLQFTKAGTRNGHAPPRRAATAAGRPSQKAPLH